VGSADKGNSARGRPGAEGPIEIDPESGALMQGGRKLALSGPELILALRKALAAEHAKSSAIVDALSEPILIFGPEATLEWSNAFAEFTLGAPAVVRGTPCHLLVCDRAEPCAGCPVASFAAQPRNPGTVRVRHDIRTSEGFLQPFELTLRRVQGPRELPRTMVLMRDIGEESAHEVTLRERLKRDDLRLEISDMLLSSRTLSETLSRFCDRAAGALGLCTVAVLVRASDGWLVPSHVVHFGQVQGGLGHLVAAGSLGLNAVFASREALLVRDVDKSGRALSIAAVLEREPRAGSGSMILAPLESRSGEVIGALVAGRVEVDGFEQEEVELLQALAARLGHAVDGGLLAEASARVTRLQEALIDQGELIATPTSDYAATTRRVLQRLTEGTGITLSGAVVLDPRDNAVRLFHLYTTGGGHRALPTASHPLPSCAFMSELARRNEVTLVHTSTLLPAERADPVVSRIVEEGERGVAFVPTGIDGKVLGWYVLGVPDPLWLSTPGEVEVLRNLAQQTRIALSWVAADGRVEAMMDDLQGHARPRG